jgi:hypothetical protein
MKPKANFEEHGIWTRTRWLAAPLIVILGILVVAFPGSVAGKSQSSSLAPSSSSVLPDSATGTYQNSLTLHLPSRLHQLTSFDISFVDPNSSTYVFTDRNNKSLDVFDTQDYQFVRASDPVFSGLGTGGGCKSGVGPNLNAGNSGGPNGVVIVGTHSDESRGHAASGVGDHERDRGVAWAGDGNSTVKAIDLNTGHQVGASISTGGFCRADELWYDPDDQEIMIGNPNDSTVFLTFISTTGTPGAQSVKGKLLFDGSPPGTPCGTSLLNGVTIKVCHTVAATAGIEQPIFALGHFWVAIGSTSAHPGGEIAEIDPTTFERVGSIGVTCGPSGLTFIPPNEAAAACGSAGVQFFDLQTMTTIGSNVAETGGADQIWFANGNVYAPDSSAANGCARTVAILTTPNPPGFTGGQPNSCVAVIDAVSMTVIAEVQLAAGAGSHSVAADSNNHRVFVPVKDSACVTGGTTPCPSPNPPGAIPPCPVAEEGGCIHDQGVAVIQLIQ